MYEELIKRLYAHCNTDRSDTITNEAADAIAALRAENVGLKELGQEVPSDCARKDRELAALRSENAKLRSTLSPVEAERDKLPDRIHEAQAERDCAREERDAYSALGTVEELTALVKALDEGRAPCKVGDTVYWLHGGAITECRVHRIQWNRSGLFLCLKSTVSHGAFRVDSIGKTLFLTRAGAEAALGGGDVR